jgi:hypothetical protein
MMMHPDDCDCKRCTGRLRPPADRITSKAALSAGNAGRGVMDPKPKRRLSRSEIKKALQPKERHVSKSIGEQLDGSGIWNSRTQSANVKLATGGYMRIGTPGTPDRIAAAGLHVWIEVKAPGKEATAEQAATIERLKANGALAFVLDDPRDLDSVLEYLKVYGPQIKTINAEIDRIQRTIDHAIANERLRRSEKGNN